MINSGVNKVFLVGNIVKEPRRHKADNGPDLLCFTLLTKEKLLKNGVVGEHCEYHSIKMPVDKAHDVTELQLGMLIYVKGKIKTTAWTDEMGIRRYNTDILGEQMQVLFNVEIPVAKEEVLA